MSTEYELHTKGARHSFEPTDSAGYTLGPVSDGGLDPRDRQAEPVKVPSDVQRLISAALAILESADRNGQIHMDESGALAGELRNAVRQARYGQHAQPAKSSLSVTYDSKGDCLYVTCDSNEPAIAEEDERGILHRYAMSDGRRVGITIPGFMGDYRQQKPTSVPAGLPEILREASAIIDAIPRGHEPENMRYFIVDELLGFASMIEDGTLT